MSRFLLTASLLFCTLMALAENVSDPTRPLQYSAPATGSTQEQSIELTSILIASDRKLVIINGQTLRELQTVKGVGAIVKKIEADAVVLQQGDKVWRVALNNTAIRK